MLINIHLDFSRCRFVHWLVGPNVLLVRHSSSIENLHEAIPLLEADDL